MTPDEYVNEISRKVVSRADAQAELDEMLDQALILSYQNRAPMVVDEFDNGVRTRTVVDYSKWVKGHA